VGISKNIILILFYLAAVYPAKAQKLSVYKDSVTNLLGVKNAYTQKDLIPAQYDQIIDTYGDSLILVQNNDSKTGVLDTTNRVIVSFGSQFIGIYNFNTQYNGKVYEFPEFNPYKYPNSQLYFVDQHRKCIPMDYYPCPWWKSITQQPIPDYQQLIYKAKQQVAMHQYDSAISYMNKAINLQPNNPAVYFTRANLLFYNDSIEDFRDKDEISSINISEPAHIIYNLNMADSLEKRPFFNLIVKTRKYDFYSRLYNNKQRRKELEDTLSKKDILIEQSGFFVVTSASWVNGMEAEVGVVYGYLNNQSGIKNIFRPSGLINYGLSWSRNFTNSYDAFRLYLFSAYRSLNFGVSPVLYYSSDYLLNDFVLRPEIGYGYKWFALQAGYNIHTAGTSFKKVDKLTISLKALIPVSTWKNFSQKTDY
jgi:tetratricopeptide (TPR) repeat protein